MKEIRTAVLEDEIVLAKSRLEPHDTGHLHDYIARLSNRLEEINPYDEDKDPYAGYTWKKTYSIQVTVSIIQHLVR